jgi:uncharacterized protein with von Willebrand factor type A (vWA) domain
VTDAAIGAHPAWVALGPEQDRDGAVALAADVLGWFSGGDAESALGRTLVAACGAAGRNLRALTVASRLLALEAAVKLVIEVWPYLRHPPDGPGDDATEDASDASDDPAEEGPGAWSAAPVAEALSAAEARVVEVGALVDALDRLAPGSGAGGAPRALERALLGNLGRLVDLLGRLPSLRALADALGRGEGRARRLKGRQGGTEVVGVRSGGDVERALASELALLADPDTEDLFYLRVSERSLMTLDLAGGELPDGRSDRRGPVVVCLDTSGSMAGAPERAAKALVLALARRILGQGRELGVLLFGAPGQLTSLRLARDTAGYANMLDLLAFSFGGGTDFDAPLLAALQATSSAVVGADVLLVTDGFARTSPSVVARIRAARREGVRLTAVQVGGSTFGSTLHTFADRVVTLNGPEDAPELSALFRDPSVEPSHGP